MTGSTPDQTQTAPVTPRRLVVVTTGLDERGTESVAAWWMGNLGEPRAGWVFPVEQAFTDPTIADRLLTAAAGGLLVAWDPAGCRALLERLRISAGREPQPDTPCQILPIGDVVARIALRSSVVTSRSDVVAGRCPVIDQVMAASALLQACARAWRELAACPRCSSQCSQQCDGLWTCDG